MTGPQPVRWTVPATLLTGWSVAFAGLSATWAAGGTLLLQGLSPAIQDLADARRPGFVVLVGASAALKLGYAALALATRRHPRSRRHAVRTLLVAAGYVGGVGTIAYAVAEAVRAVADPGVPTAWYLLMWDPWWIAGGLLLVLVTREYRHRA